MSDKKKTAIIKYACIISAAMLAGVLTARYVNSPVLGTTKETETVYSEQVHTSDEITGTTIRQETDEIKRAGDSQQTMDSKETSKNGEAGSSPNAYAAQTGGKTEVDTSQTDSSKESHTEQKAGEQETYTAQTDSEGQSFSETFQAETGEENETAAGGVYEYAVSEDFENNFNETYQYDEWEGADEYRESGMEYEYRYEAGTEYSNRDSVEHSTEQSETYPQDHGVIVIE